MTEEQMTTEIETEEQPASENAELRAAYEREKERRQSAEQKNVGHELAAIGLDPSEGLGKAIAKEYDGEMTREAIALYAQEEYNFSPVGVDVPEQTQEVIEGQEQVDKLDSASTSVVPVSQEDELAAHDQRLAQDDATQEDAERSLNAKLGTFVAEHYPNKT